MKNICLYFQVHQPFRLNRFSFMDIGNGVPYYDEMLNSEILRQVSLQSYLPANRALMKLIKAGNRQLHVNFSISGTALDQFERYMPELIESFRALADTGCVEFMSDTYSHSLAALKSSEEFNLQVKKHTARVAALFGKTPRVFRNTEQIYNNKIADMAAAMGFVATLTNGASLENKIINLFIDYQTFGKFHEHADVISTFAQYLPNEILLQNNHLLRPEGVTKLLPAVASLMRPQITIPQEENYDLRPWLNNDMQQDAFDTLYALGKKVRATDDDQLKQDWSYLQSADHFYYMGIQDPGNSLSPFDSPFDAFINYMNVLTDFSLRTDNSLEKKKITPHGRYTLEAGLYI
ncbi:Glycosyl hydrolase family 57 [Chitinophaga ginsengisegetis]|uniref:Glycosyl hydrolase family 57 n=1 Tax=Chitinophaga ginsengisegetis TaxID=393003 RepID=A0A1T5NBP3_9BACT|nr:polysaccharide deacetylase family protein [Chitinophaga ginsengisegetis]SKC97871.1 Glycosyl hydrolase family 57 [Chitinophaga ginsengisegetis]